MNFAKTVAEQRKKKNMTQEDLARRLGITPQAVSKWENGIGLPDVALFPSIAEILDLSINELFGLPRESGASERTDDSVPQTFEGLPLAVKVDRLICYSDKTVKKNADTEILFADGSRVDILSGRVINRGTGEIRVIRTTDFSREDLGGEIVTRCKEFPAFSSMSVFLSYCCELKVLVDTQGVPRMRAKGRERLLNYLETGVEDGKLTLRLDVQGQKNGNPRDTVCEIELYVPFECGEDLHLSISGLAEAAVSPCFARAEIAISGCGEVTARSFDELTARIAGSGDILVRHVSEKTKLRISGSGSIRATSMTDPDVRISGSGEISSEETEGEAKVSIAGSGDVSLGAVELQSADVRITGSGDLCMRGRAENLQMQVSGSGSLAGEALTVDRAELTVNGAGEIAIGQIISESVEQLSRDAKLRVYQRG